jgi:S-adenosylmethionine synthetase
MNKNFIFSSESVGEGHPDKVCDAISDYVLDACLRYDRTSRVACECYAKSNVVVVGGEITIPKIRFRPPSDVIDFVGIARKAIRDIGYVHQDDSFHADKVFVNCYITGQSKDIAQGVTPERRKARRRPNRERATRV